MTRGLVFALISMMLLGAAIYFFYVGQRRKGAERALIRLAEGQPQASTDRGSMTSLERAFLRAGLGRPNDRLGVWLACWVMGLLLGLLLGGWVGVLLMALLPPLVLRVYMGVRYQRRVRRMVEQLPAMLDHTIRSLKSGRTLADAVLGGIQASVDPLKDAMGRVERNVQLGVGLPEAVNDFAELYERDEFRLFALGLKVNHRYGGNASELMENLIKMIREREQGARQLRAMTGETRMTALVLGILPLTVAGYFLLSNPSYLMNMWDEPSGQHMLLSAVTLQSLGCLVLWRMLRSV